MKFFSITVLAAVTGALAYPGNVTVVTEVVESYVTFCPTPTEIVHGSSTWTVTAPTTITITDCPCTITKPVIITSSVICHTCTEHIPVHTSVPSYNNATISVPPASTGGVIVTDIPGVPATPTEIPAPVPTGAAAKLGFSGLAGMAFLAALL